MNRFATMIFGKTARLKRRAKPKFAPKLLIFDFDGTIGDTFAAGLEILNLLSTEFGFRPLREEDVPRARDMRTHQLMKFLGIKTSRLAKISARGTIELKKRIDGVQPLEGVPAALRELHKRGHPLGIVTSNTEENVRIFLKNHDLEIFDFVRCSSKLFGKAREIRGARKRARAKKHEVLFIGDETRDIEACQKAGVRIAAVTWGYNSPSALCALKPDYLLNSPGELIALLEPYLPESPPSGA